MPEDTSAADAAVSFVIVNARVWTGDPRRPWADAVLVRGDEIVGVGTSAELRKRAGARARVIDAGGRIVRALAPGAKLAAGARADLVIVDRGVSTESSPEPRDDVVALRLEGGRVVFDRDALASGRA